MMKRWVMTTFALMAFTGSGLSVVCQQQNTDALSLNQTIKIALDLKLVKWGEAGESSGAATVGETEAKGLA